MKGNSLFSMVKNRIAAYPSSGEINSKIQDPQSAINRVRNLFEKDAVSLDLTDGVYLDFDDWGFNLRSSNTEPVVRLNVEARENIMLMKNKTQEILNILNSK